ncbi:MAG: STAS/SEC14 domain-containing protein [Candidatus Omnitrophica bacterium]|nr:STAS/SEC14 domain-containing protein [Candidatus Omnitrophota bacterium]MBU1127590.1 STAS/SEC14 domain-containing protein [Candidatus Omnitrophota bacterium]MBU1783877.1 STAS/SEC14 domain-containing protein [Candidatus Omnitrophota bacterium]MBU1851714.1 STAS/SEC14 domain-containing protein [Candidatus Omnitrophota bacterium]
MGIEKIHHEHTSVFGFKITDKLTTGEIKTFLPEMEDAFSRAHNKLRLLIDVTEMHNAGLKAEWEIFEFLKKHIKGIEYIAIVGAHSWIKIMSEVLADSIFVMAETRYFEPEETEDAWTWMTKAIHPRHIPVRRVIRSDKGLFTKYGSPGYI